MQRNEEPFRRSYRWIMAVLILILPFCTMVPYVVPAVFMTDIMETFQVDLGLAGLSMTIQLGATGVCMFIGSYIQDRLGIQKSMILSVWAMAIGNGIAAAAPNITVFLAARLLAGFGQGQYTVSMNPCISTWFDGKERTYVVTFNSVANSAFLALSYAIGQPLRGVLGGWQRVIGLYTALIVVVAVLWTFASRESPEAVAAAKEQAALEGQEKKQSSLLRAAKEPQYWKLMVVGGTFAFANSAIASFLPTYLTQERGMDMAVATTISSLNSLFGIAGSLIGGFFCAQTRRRKPLILISGILYVILGFGLTIFNSSGVLIVLALLVGALYFFPMPAQTNMQIETKQPLDPAILGGAACITGGISQFLCLFVSFLFSAVANAFDMTIAYRIFFSLCILGIVVCLFTRETGK